MPQLSTYPARSLAKVIGLDSAGRVGLAANAASVPNVAYGGNLNLAVFGHSFAARFHYQYANGTLGTTIGKTSFGGAAWIEALSGGRILMPLSLNFGVSGENTTQMLARCDAAVASAVAQKCSAVLFFGLFNDAVATTAQIATTIANVTAIAQKWTDAGIQFIITGDYPAGSASLTTYRRTGNQLLGFMQIRRWILETLPTLITNVTVFDVWDQVGLWNSTTADVVSGYFDPADQLHPFSPFYRSVYVPRLLSILDRQLAPIQGFRSTSNSESYDATYNRRGNLLSNGMFDGNVSGVATGWTKTDATGITGTATKVVGTNIEWQQVSYTGTATAAGAVSDVRQNLSFTNIAAGDTLSVECLTEHDANAINLRGIELRLVIFDTVGAGNTYESKSFAWTTQGDVIGTSAYTGASALYHRTPDLKLPVGALASGPSGYVAVRAIWDGAVASSAVIRMGKLRLHKTA